MRDRRLSASRLSWVAPIAAAPIVVAIYWLFGADTPADGPQQTPSAVYGHEIVREYPHDPEAFTQGLIYHDGFLYESTGLIGRSSLRKVRLETGEVIQQRPLDELYFGEGLTEWNGRLVQLTPMRVGVDVPAALLQIGRGDTSVLPALARHFGVNVGSRYDIASFEPQSTFSYDGEGWGLTRDDRRMIKSDGRAELQFLDPETFAELDRVKVMDHGQPVVNLNELEFVKGEIYANVWFQNRIAIIRPDSGRVVAWIDLSGLAPPRPAGDPSGAVLNGIAYDAEGDRLFVTGKLWPRVYEIRLRPPRAGAAATAGT